MRESASLASTGWIPNAGYAPVWARASVSVLISSMVRSAVCAEAVSLVSPIKATAKVAKNRRIFFVFLPVVPRLWAGEGEDTRDRRMIRGGPEGLAFDQFLDAALQLALFLFAFAQAFGEVRTRQFVRLFRIERHADEIVAPPDDPRHHRAPLARDRQPQRILGQAYSVVEFEVGAMLGNV